MRVIALPIAFYLQHPRRCLASVIKCSQILKRKVVPVPLANGNGSHMFSYLGNGSFAPKCATRITLRNEPVISYGVLVNGPILYHPNFSRRLGKTFARLVVCILSISITPTLYRCSHFFQTYALRSRVSHSKTQKQSQHFVAFCWLWWGTKASKIV